MSKMVYIEKRELDFLRKEISKLKELQEENEFLHNIIDNYITQTKKNETAPDEVTEYEEWLDSPNGELLAMAYEDAYNIQEVAIGTTKLSDDAKERLAKSKLWI